MTRPDELVEGGCYFTVSFQDRDMRLPWVETLIYRRYEPSDGEEPRWMFQYPPAMADDDGEAAPEEPAFFAYPASQLSMILDFPTLLARLAELSVDHPGPATAKPASADDVDRAELGRQVRGFLDDPSCQGLTASIRFTGDGVSVLREPDGGFGIHLSLHPRRDPASEASARALFAGLGITARTDYVADRGRTRLLGYPVAPDVETIVGLCVRVLLDVHAMRQGDAIDYHLLRSADVVRPDRPR